MIACPSCGSSPLVITTALDDDDVEYSRHGCNACGWASDEPSLSISRGHEGACENCGLPILAGEFVRRYADEVVTHGECPKVARA